MIQIKHGSLLRRKKRHLISEDLAEQTQEWVYNEKATQH